MTDDRDALREAIEWATYCGTYVICGEFQPKSLRKAMHEVRILK